MIAGSPLRSSPACLILPAPNPVGFRRREKDVIERARGDEIDDGGAAPIDMVDPAARYRAAKEDREEPLDRLRGSRRRVEVSHLERGGLGLDRFRMRPAPAGGLVHAPVVQQFVNDEPLGVEAMPVPEVLQGPGDRRIVAPRERRIAANKPGPLEMMSRLGCDSYRIEASGA